MTLSGLARLNIRLLMSTFYHSTSADASDAEQRQLEALTRAGNAPADRQTHRAIISLAHAGFAQSADHGGGRYVTQSGAEVAQALCTVRADLVPFGRGGRALGRLGALHDLPRSGRSPIFFPVGPPSHCDRRGMSRS